MNDSKEIYYPNPKEIFEQYIDEHNNVVWTDDALINTRIAQALLGKSVVGSFDYWIELAVDYLNNTEPQKPYPTHNVAYKIDRYFRDGLTQLTDEQKEVVRQLVLKIAKGVLFGVMVELDQTYGGYYSLSLELEQSDMSTKEISIAPDPDGWDLHELQVCWLNAFSKNAEELFFEEYE